MEIDREGLILNKKVVGMVVTSIVAISSITIIPSLASQDENNKAKENNASIEESLETTNTKVDAKDKSVEGEDLELAKGETTRSESKSTYKSAKRVESKNRSVAQSKNRVVPELSNTSDNKNTQSYVVENKYNNDKNKSNITSSKNIERNKIENKDTNKQNNNFIELNSDINKTNNIQSNKSNETFEIEKPKTENKDTNENNNFIELNTDKNKTNNTQSNKNNEASKTEKPKTEDKITNEKDKTPIKEDTDKKDNNTSTDKNKPNTGNNDKIEKRSSLKASDLRISPAEFIESEKEPGKVENKVKVTISNDTKAIFAKDIDGDVDALASASAMGLNKGYKLNVKRENDKNITLSLVGKAENHNANINKDKSKSDYNKNDIYGDFKVLMLPEFFENKSSVENGGLYAIADIVYKDSEQAKENNIVNLSKTKLIKVEETGYAVVTLAKGNIENTKITINSKEVKPTRVNSEGTIVKFEVNPNEIAKIEVTQGNDSEDFVLNEKGKAFTKVIKNEAPDKILVSGPMSKLDYHQANFDSKGNIRLKPSKTTFSTSKEVVVKDETLPQLDISKTKLGNDVVINIDENTDKAKKWQKNIYSIETVADNNPNVTSKLQYSLENGKIVIDKNSAAINDRNGIHNIRIKSEGYNDLNTKIEIVKSAGKILLSGNYNFYANNELLFELEGFNYAVVNPIYEVRLDGKALKGNCKEYHIVDYLIRLEDNCIDKLTKGKHELTVKAHGFEDFNRTFYLEEAPKGLENPSMGHGEKVKLDKIENMQMINSGNKKVESKVDVDAIGSASDKGSSSETPDAVGGASGGSTIIRGNIVYDFDLLSNAMILNNLGMATKNSSEVLSWWNAMTKDAVLTNESTKVIDYKKYKNAVNEAKGNGEYLTFKNYYDKIEKSDYLNKPYQVKYILEDGLFGNVQTYSQENLKIVPKMTVSGNKEDKIYLGIENDTQYLKNLENVSIGINTLPKDAYKVEANKITITDTSLLKHGDNTIKLQAKGYKEASVDINLLKNSAKLGLSKDENNNIIVKLDKNYKNEIESIILNGKALLDDTQLGGNSGDYEYKGDSLVLRSKLFDTNKDRQYTVVIKANGYKDSKAMFNLDELNIKEVDKIKVPNYVKLSSENKYYKNERVLVDVERMFDTKYRDDIKEVLLDGKKVMYSNPIGNFYSIELGSKNFKEEKTYKLTIKTNKYEDFNTDIKIVNKVEKKEAPRLEVKTENNKTIFTSKDDKYIDNVLAVKVDYKTIDKKDYIVENNKLTILDKLPEGTKVTFESDKYENYVYVVPKAVNTSKENDKSGKINVPNYVALNNGNTYKVNKDVVVDVKHPFNNEYLKDIQEVLLDGKKIDYKESNTYFNSIVLESENFKEEKLYKITIKTNKYKDFNADIKIGDKTIDVEKINKEDEDKQNQNENKDKKYEEQQVIKKQVPNIEEDIQGGLLNKARFISEAEYIKSISRVKLNDENLERESSVSPNEGYNIEAGTLTILNKIIGGDKITFESDKYEDYTCIVPKKSANIEVSRNSNNKFVFNSNDQAWTKSAYVLVNGSKLSKGEFEADFGKITVIKDLKPCDNLVIQSQGFNDFEYEVALLKADVNVKKNTLFNKSYSFTTSSNSWKGNITSVKVNGAEISQTNDYSPTEGYKENYNGGVDVYNSLSSGDTVSIEANGYEAFTYVVS